MEKEIKFSEERLKQVQEVISHYPEGMQKSAIIAVLFMAQKDFGGWLDVPVMNYVAQLLDLKKIEVYEVASFYTMFNLKPLGKYVFEVCQTGPCMACGSHEIIRHLEEKLGIKSGETTPDGLFTIKPAECLGACGYAPMMQLGKHYREHLTIEKVDELIERCKAGTEPVD